jgi:cell division inhibitor SepF
MGNVMNKILGMINMGQGAEDTEDIEDIEEIEDIDNGYAEEDSYESEGLRGLFGGSRRRETVSSSVKMSILQPTSYEDAFEVCDLLRERKSIIINLEYINKDVARKVIDVISGASRVLDGHMEKINSTIFLIAPSNYDIASSEKEERIKSKFRA